MIFTGVRGCRPSPINQAAAQADPTPTSPINFTVTFNRAVTGFASNDVTLGGTAGATTAVVSGGPAVYNVAVSGMTVSGTVTAAVVASAAGSMRDWSRARPRPAATTP